MATIFLALPSQIVKLRNQRAVGAHPETRGPGVPECKALLGELRRAGFRVFCPLEDVGWQDPLPADPAHTLAERLRSLEEADHVVTLPKVGEHKSSGVMGLTFYAVAKRKPVTVFVEGSSDLDVPWQILGLNGNDNYDLRIAFYQGSLADGYTDLFSDIRREPSRAAAGAAGAETGAKAEADPCPFGPRLQLYWNQRHDLFRRWDEGIQTDAAGLYTIKPELIADEIANTIHGKRVLDAFCGVGGMAVALARQGKQVVAVEVNANRLAMARHNAELYGVAGQIHFVHGDVLQVFQEYDFDAAYLDPAWGGPDYIRSKWFRFDDFEPDVRPLIEALVKKDVEIALTIPKNFSYPELQAFHQKLLDLHSSSCPAKREMVQRWNCLDNRLLFTTVFF